MISQPLGYSPRILFLLSSELDFKWVNTFKKKTKAQLSKFGISSEFLDVVDVKNDLKFAFRKSEFVWVALVGAEIKINYPLFAHSLLEAMQTHDEVDLIYFDSHTYPKGAGERPDFSPERLRSQNYFGPLVVLNTTHLEKVSIKLPDYSFIEVTYWLFLAMTRLGLSFRHIDKPTYKEVLSRKKQSYSSKQVYGLIVQEHLNLTGGGKTITQEPDSHGCISSYRISKQTPLVSIVIPTRGVFSSNPSSEESLVLNAVQSIVTLTEYENYELVIVVDEGAEEKVLRELRSLGGNRLSIVEWQKPFNFSQKMNYGVLHSRGELILLLNDDVKVISSLWLTAMVGLAQLENTGMVGAMLYYEDDTIQHAGHAYYLGSPTHIGLGLPKGTQGHNNSFLIEREVSGVTSACALMPKSVFMEVGGFTPLLPGNFNDVDLCLKVNRLGYTILWTPYAELYHFESKTRDAHVHYYELDIIEKRWGLQLNDQRFWRGHPWRET